MKPPPLPEKLVLTTSDNIEGKKLRKYLGPISGFSAKSLGIKGAFRLTAGRTELKDHSSLVAQTQQAALDHLLQEAKAIDADAVIALRIDMEFLESVCVASCYGTAVMCSQVDDG